MHRNVTTHFILVEPAVSENIGAAARAIKTMGFSSLVLINPKASHLNTKAKMLAHGSLDILKNAQVFSDLKNFIDDLDLAIATTAKKRSAKYDYHPATDLKKIIESKRKAIKEIGIVFGREESGLTNQELQICDLASTIPLNTGYPSLNLAQAVMIYAYELSNIQINSHKEVSSPKTLNTLKQKLDQVLVSANIHQNPNLYHRIFERVALMEEEDIHLMLSFLERLKKDQ